MAAKKSKKPTGLTLARDKRKFTCGWKCGTKDYDDGQKAIFMENVQYLAYDQQRRATKPVYTTWETNLNPTASDNSKSHSISLTNYFPTTNTFLLSTSFKVCGNRDKKKGMKSDPTWSDWSSKSFDVKAPYDPVITDTLDQSEDRTTIFSWTSTLSDSNAHIFYDYLWESVLTKNGASPNWAAYDARRSANGIDPDTGGSDTGSTTINDVVYTWNITKGSGSVTISEDSNVVYANVTDTYTRWVRVQARGPGGASGWAVAKHVYGTPQAIEELSANPVAKATSGNSSLLISLAWTAYKKYVGADKQTNPIDYVEVQYCIQSPTITVNTSGNEYKSTIEFNQNSAQWTNAPGGVIRDSESFDAYSFSLDTSIPTNNMMFLRVNSTHDRRTTYGKIIEVEDSKSFLDPPSGLLINDVDAEQFRILITKPQNNCGIPNSFTAIYYRSSSKSNEERVVGIVPWGEESGTMLIQCPRWNDTDAPGLGMKTIIGNYSPITSSVLVDQYSVSEKWSSNGIDWMAGTIPLPPRLEVDKFADRPYDTIEAKWDWKWSEANAAELSWSNKKDAWMSTSEPSKYVISGVHASVWHITDLEPTTWWVRCRLLRETSDGTNYGAYSSAKDVTLSTLPKAPSLNTDTPTISAGNNFTIYWSYYNEDGTKPDKAELGLATVTNGTVTYPAEHFMQLSKSTYEQKETLSATSLGWAAGSTHYLVVRVISESGQRSDWSYPLAIHVVPPVTASISGTVISSQILTSMPFSVNVSGIGTDGIASAVITRRDSYSIVRPELRPDEAPDDGFAGEIIAVASRSGSGDLTFSRDNLIGRLDDGAYYTIVGSVVDSYGQTAETTPVDFCVNWDHQAIMPEAEIEIDNEHLATLITPLAVTGSGVGDTVDIYRLSADRPELIVKGGTLGTRYVDPYPTLGEFGGHRIVFITKDGDYITEDNTLAMIDFPDEDDEEVVDRIDYFGAVIDFGSEQIRLPYNIELSNSWNKDFTEVKYLGGSVQGYWNKAVSRSGSVRTSVVIQEDVAGPDTIRALRRLAVWPGICHIRTPDGSSYAANIDVSEDRENKWVRRLASVTLNITRVDSQTEDGMTYDEWLETL